MSAGPPVRIGIQFDIPAGAPAGLDTSISRISQQIETGINRGLSRTGGILDDLNRKSGTFLTTLTQISTSAASITYVIERIASLAKTALVDPFVNLNKAILDATENSRKFEYSISGVAGGLSNARALNTSLIVGSQNLPVNVGQLRDAARTLAANPSFAASLGLGGTSDAAQSVQQFAELEQRLSLLAPEGVNAGNALRQAIGGNFRSLRALGIGGSDALGSLIGTPGSQLNNNPALTLDAISKWADVFLPESDYDRITGLVGNRYEKLQDAVSFALQKVGDSGLYDSISARMKKLSDGLFGYFGGPDFDRQASRISTSLDRTIGNVVKGAQTLLDSVTGAGGSDLSSIGGAVTTLGNVLDRIAHLSDSLPNALHDLGPAISGFSDRIGKFFDAVVQISDAVNNPQAYAGKQLANSFVGRAATGVVETSIPAATAAVRAGNALNQSRVGYWLSLPARIETGLAAGLWNSIGAGGIADQEAQTQALIAGARGAGPLTGFAGATTRPTTQPTLSPRADEPYINSLVRQLTGQEYSAPNFAALLAGSNANVTELRNLAGKMESPLDQLARLGDVFGSVSIHNEPVSFQDLLSRIDQQKDSAIGTLNTALGDTHDPDQINYLNAAKQQIQESWQNAFKQITASKLADVKDFDTELFKASSELGPSGAAVLQNSVIGGTTSADQQFQQVFGGAPQGGFGIQRFSIDEQRKLLDQSYTTNSDAIRARDINQPTLTADTDVLNYLQNSALPNAQSLLGRARDAYVNSPTDLNLAQFQAAQADVDKLTSGVEKLRFATDDTAQSFAKFGSEARSAFEDTLGKSLTALETGVGSLRDVFKSFTTEILGDFNQLAAHQFVQSLVGNLGVAGAGPNGTPGGLGGLFGNIASGLGSFFSGAGSVSSAISATSGAVDVTGASSLFQAIPVALSAAANGGIFPGGFHAFGTGGIVNSPTLGLVGEGNYNEAIVPLPDGRSIPVDMNGGGQTVVHNHFNISTPDAGSFRASQKQIMRRAKEMMQR